MKNETTPADISYDALFARLSDVREPRGLDHAIVQTIYAKETRAAEVRFAFLGTMSVASIAGIVTSSIYISHDVAQSGFEQYLSLILLRQFRPHYLLEAVRALPHRDTPPRRGRDFPFRSRASSSGLPQKRRRMACVSSRKWHNTSYIAIIYLNSIT